MILKFKVLTKLLALIIISFCATFISYLFLNFQLDLKNIESQVLGTHLENLYHAKITIGKVVIGMSGGSLGCIAIIILFFYIKQFIDDHRKELGILKALGYSNLEISSQFLLFGTTIFIGSSLAITIAHYFMAHFYTIQITTTTLSLPNINPSVHFVLILLLTILPAVVFSGLAFLYAYFQLNIPTISLLKNQIHNQKVKQRPTKNTNTFLQSLKRTNKSSNKILIFFIWFAGFTFSTMLNLSFGIKDFADEWISYLMIIVGLVISYTILIIALSVIIKKQSKTIAMLRIFGYHQIEIRANILDIYRPVSYIGLFIGLFYQYALLNGLFYFLNKENQFHLEYKINWSNALGVSALFALSYELLLFLWNKKMSTIPFKVIMETE